jgi:formylglycine-generating enzyme required for sulfatase activity
MVWINPGTYTRGSSHLDDWNASPPHQVTLTSGFYMGIYQITQEQWFAVMLGNQNYISVSPSWFDGTQGITYGVGFNKEPAAGEVQRKRPVERVSWYDVIVFCNRLSIMEGLIPAYRIPGFGNSDDPNVWGITPNYLSYLYYNLYDHDPQYLYDLCDLYDLDFYDDGWLLMDILCSIWDAVEIVPGSNGYRLPTEAQWEYACRAGTTTAYNTGDTVSDDTGWYGENSGRRTRQVGLKPPNAWGLFDMHGNVYDWCWDRFGTYSSDPQTDPEGPISGSDRVIRGGDFFFGENAIRSAFRYNYDPLRMSSEGIGFRLLRP